VSKSQISNKFVMIILFLHEWNKLFILDA